MCFMCFTAFERETNKQVNEIKKKGKGPPIYILYIFRIVRIVPTYVFFLMFFVGTLKYLGDGPLWYLVEAHTKPCLSNWWTNLLFINNFLPVDETKVCLSVCVCLCMRAY